MLRLLGGNIDARPDVRRRGLAKHIRVSVLVVAILAATGTSTITIAARAAGGDQDDERHMLAQTLLEQGVKMASSDPKAALGAYRSSYATLPDFKVLYQIGKVCMRLKDAPCAVNAYDRYLRDGGSDVPSKRRKEVDKELKSLSRSVGAITIKSNIKDADVKVDGAVVGKTPLQSPIAVGAGTHKVVLALDGAVEKTVQIAAGGKEDVELEPATKSAPAAAVAPAAVLGDAEQTAPSKDDNTSLAKHETGRRGSFPVIPWIVTGALGAGTGAMGYATWHAYVDYKIKRNTYPITAQDLDAAHSNAQKLLFVTAGLGVASLVSLGVSVYATLTRSSSSIAPDNGKDKLLIGIASIAIGPNGISVTGRIP